MGDRKRQCRAELLSAAAGGDNLRCDGEVTDEAVHIEDHWAAVGSEGNVIRWTDAVAVYPTRDAQVGGEHYKKFAIHPWDVWEEYGLDPWLANCVKYLLRAGHKGPKVEDLRKARHYLDRAIERAIDHGPDA
jgi:hypothetical protein